MSESRQESSLDYYNPEDKVLRLDVSRTPRPYPKDESFWDLEIRRLLKLVQSHLDVTAASKMRQRQGASSFDKPHLSIAIFGTYGSGKTSLLKTMVDRIREEDLPEGFDALKNRVYSLPIIEPSTLSSHSTFLYSFLATALEEDLNRDRQVGGGRPYPGSQRSELGTRQQAPGQTHVLTPVQQAFQEVSEYLQVVDDPGLDSRDYDPLGLSLERLERHTSGLRLSRKLSDMIDALADRLGGPDSVLLMPVDDADMARDGLISTLETYRSYLMHPRLVPVFTFTDRLAEELVRTHFNKKLALEEVRALSGKKAEVATYSDSTRNLAYQYLVKLFPVRNRLRLGMAAARVQAARYEVEGESVAVEELLRIASKLLYGPQDSAIDSAIQRALRPSTLRRQLQVIDAVLDSGVEQLRTAPKDLAWSRIFSNTTWSLLNVHRDALQEFGLHMEDLYSRSPRDLERHVRATLLRQPPEVRRRLLWSWRYRDEERQVQVLSLLAAAMYRPRLFGEEPAGDDPAEWASYEKELARLVQSEQEKDRGKQGTYAFPEEARQLPVFDAVIWFLELWFGFYLPQILSSDLDADPTKESGDRARSAEAGWTLKSAPSQAMKLARRSEGKWPGMMSRDPQQVAKLLASITDQLENGSETPDFQDFHTLHLWCFYGVGREGEPWASFSFWRGLSLLGRLMKSYRSFPKLEAEIDEIDRKLERLEELDETATQKERNLKKSKEGDLEVIRKDAFVEILRDHYEAAREPGYRHKKGSQGFPWPEKKRFEEDGDIGEELRDKADKHLKWLEECEEAWVTPQVFEPEASEGRKSRNGNASFVRQLHGDAMLGQFWRKLEEVFLEPPDETEEEEDPWETKKELQKLDAELQKLLGDFDEFFKEEERSEAEEAEEGKEEQETDEAEEDEEAQKTEEAQEDEERKDQIQALRDARKELARVRDDIHIELSLSWWQKQLRDQEDKEMKDLGQTSQNLMERARRLGVAPDDRSSLWQQAEDQNRHWRLSAIAERFKQILSQYFEGVAIAYKKEDEKKEKTLGPWLAKAKIFDVGDADLGGGDNSPALEPGENGANEDPGNDDPPEGGENS